jgi:hypothetical protein
MVQLFHHSDIWDYYYFFFKLFLQPILTARTILVPSSWFFLLYIDFVIGFMFSFRKKTKTIILTPKSQGQTTYGMFPVRYPPTVSSQHNYPGLLSHQAATCQQHHHWIKNLNHLGYPSFIPTSNVPEVSPAQSSTSSHLLSSTILFLMASFI